MRSTLALMLLLVAAAVFIGCSGDNATEPVNGALSPQDVLQWTPEQLDAAFESPDKCFWRPFSDYVVTQGTYCFDDGEGGCIDFEPPMKNFLGWTDPDLPFNALFEYLGNADPYLQAETGGEIDLGTRISGRVFELPLCDGRALIRVVVQVRNILAWVTETEDYYLDPIVFGARVADVLAGAEPALANGRISVTWIGPAKNAPIPDLFQLLLVPEDDQVLLFVNTQLLATGAFHEGSGYAEGTVGQVDVSQIYVRPPDGDYASGWPVESVEFLVDD